MGVVEDVRSALQDFITPELRALSARVHALEKQQEQFRADAEKRFDKVDGRLEKLEDTMKTQFNAVDVQFEMLNDKLGGRHDELISEIRRTAAIHDLAERVAKLEAGRPPAH
jgi:hypothetical protein